MAQLRVKMMRLSWRTRIQRAAGLAQILEQREYLASDAFDLTVALFIRADEIERDVANARGVEVAHAVGDLLGGPEGGVTLGRLAEVHGIAVAQCQRGRIEGLGGSIGEPR